MSAPNTKKARTERPRRNAFVAAARHKDEKQAFSEASVAVADTQPDRVVVLNVGGTKITTLQSTLCSSPSLLAEWTKSNFSQFPRDLQGHPFLDRDPENFRHILNYLRGYGLPNKADDLVVVAEDAEQYQLDTLKREIGLNPPPMWKFMPGPGVREDGVEFSTSDILDMCGTEPLSTGLVHTIVFRVDKCELVSIGVVAFKEIQHDMQIRRQKNTVCYCNTGELVRYWSADPLYEQGVLYKGQDEITVRVEFAQPGVPFEAVGAAGARGGLPPPLQPALGLSESLATGTTTVTTMIAPLPSNIGGLTRPLIGGDGVPTITTINTASASEAPGTSSAVQSSSPVLDASTNRPNPPPRVPAPANTATTPTTIGGSTGDPPQLTRSPALMATTPTTTLTAGTAVSSAAAPHTPALPVAPIVLDPEDPDVPIGAVVTFMKGDREVCRARWPSPVPPLQFAVSMQGASAVSILKASSISPGDAVAMIDLQE